MPTGYTADVQSGKVTEFADFAMQCASAFGACVTMRDDPPGTPIPEEFKPSTWHEERAEKDEKEISRLRSLDAAEVQAEYDAEFKSLCDYHVEAKAKRREEKARYEAMLEQVKAWKPPSVEHHGMKQFMLEQLQSSIEWDCSESYETPAPKREDASVWLARALSQLYASVERNRRSQIEENERTAKRNLWVRQLRESLQQVTA